ncbi:MAG: nucleoside 2-deoxyribosyltransferase domain-containing protein [Patescibacteria group bacterium]
MIEIKAPNIIPDTKDKKIFLAGSIEMNTAEDWQHRVVSLLEKEQVVFLNPRREHWESSWEQKIDNKNFKEQVDWELDALDASDYIVMYFDPNTKSPISLLELGLYATSGKLLVVCPEGFWRKGNVDIVCERYKISQFSSINELVEHLSGLFS